MCCGNCGELCSDEGTQCSKETAPCGNESSSGDNECVRYRDVGSYRREMSSMPRRYDGAGRRLVLQQGTSPIERSKLCLE